MRRRFVFALLLAAALLTSATLLALTVSACGGTSAKDRDAARNVQITYLSRGLRVREQAAAKRVRSAAYARCRANVGDLVHALNELNSRLSVGLNFSSYSDRVGDVRAAYDKMDVSSLAYGDCLNAAVRSEQAMNSYTKAYNTWNDCIGDINCSNDSIDSKLQADWAKATPKVESATAALERVRTNGGPAVGGWTRGVPSSSVEVDDSIYGAARRELCGVKAPVDAVEPCQQLRDALANGVTEGEFGDIDDAIERLNVIYDFAPAPTA